MLCKNCNEEIRMGERVNLSYYHVKTGVAICYLYATPILSHINRHLDAQAILDGMASREAAKRPPVKERVADPNKVEGTFVGEL